MITVHSYSRADMTQGHGVLSAHDEQLALVQTYLSKEISITEEGHEHAMINHFHTINPQFLISILVGRVQGSVNVGYVHFLPDTLKNSIRLPKWAEKIFYRYVLFFYRQMDELVVVNPYFIDELAHSGVPREKVTYIPNVVSAKRFYPMEKAERLAARRDFGLSEDTFIVLCAGQLQRRKGVLDFVRLAEKTPDALFVWAGDFSFGEISQDHDQIQRLVEHPPENVRFIGLVPHEKMNALYNACDLMLLPSYEELFPMTILEAMSCHRPVLVRKLDIYDKILFDYVGYATEEENFLSYLRRLREDSSFYAACCEKSAQGSAHYSEPTVAALWREYYTRIAAKSKVK